MVSQRLVQDQICSSQFIVWCVSTIILLNRPHSFKGHIDTSSGLQTPGKRTSRNDFAENAKCCGERLVWVTVEYVHPIELFLYLDLFIHLGQLLSHFFQDFWKSNYIQSLLSNLFAIVSMTAEIKIFIRTGSILHPMEFSWFDKFLYPFAVMKVLLLESTTNWPAFEKLATVFLIQLTPLNSARTAWCPPRHISVVIAIPLFGRIRGICVVRGVHHQ